MGTVFGTVNVEQATFKVVKKTNDYEVREYEPCVRATVTLPGKDVTSGDGFRLLADYIFGDNVKDGGKENIAMTAPVATEEKISMTAPVVTANSEGGSGKEIEMSFFMPSKYKKISDLPTPKNSQVRLEEVPAYTMAVVSFSGNAYEDYVLQREEQLKKDVQRDGLQILVEKAVLMRYNPPWCLPFLKTNELGLKINYKESGEGSELPK
eukprot:TRINITY_DN789_c0_g1_i2.p1 TRINITY_DN789_c0_g1~~TRINITY_DN789_c0_g1_i2.p1  ORF type:complete len:209 (+),score=58.74 TRINITY_DN789_c0_g1_i2:112-738(+)